MPPAHIYSDNILVASTQNIGSSRNLYTFMYIGCIIHLQRQQACKDKGVLRRVKRRACLLPRTVILQALSSNKQAAARRSILCHAASLPHTAMHADTHLHWTTLTIRHTFALDYTNKSPATHLICSYISSHITFLVFASALVSALS
jgi:hypothetical protein